MDIYIIKLYIFEYVCRIFRLHADFVPLSFWNTFKFYEQKIMSKVLSKLRKIWMFNNSMFNFISTP